MPTLARHAHIATWVVIAAMSVGISRADTVSVSFDTVARYTGTDPILGSAPWLTLSVLDVAPGSVQVTVNTLLPNSGSPPQTLTGLWLNVPGAIAGGLSSLSLTAGAGTGANPAAFIAGGSTFSTTQTTTPAGATAAQVGRYNVFLRFPNSGTASFQDHETQTFLLSGTGLTAAAFFALAGQTAGGLPSPSFYGLASLTNAAGTAGSGIAYIGALSAQLTAVPLPAALVLFCSGLLGLSVGRRRVTG